MPAFPVTDDKGHVYANPKELSEAIEWLENDAGYLRRQVGKYSDPAVKERIRQNAEHSHQYSVSLRRLGSR